MAAPLPPFLASAPGGTLLRVKVQPRAARDEIGEPTGDELKIRVTAPPVDSAANEAVVILLAQALGVHRGAVRLVRGQTSRHKSIWVAELDPTAVLARLTSP